MLFYIFSDEFTMQIYIFSDEYWKKNHIFWTNVVR